MSFISLLNQVKRKSTSPEPTSGNKSYAYKAPEKNQPKQAPINAIPSDYKPRMDPAVARLKELRRLEKEKEAAEKAKNSQKRAKASVTRRRQQPALTTEQQRARITQQVQGNAPLRSKSPVKRLTFAQLMAEAEQKTKQLNAQAKEPTPTTETPKPQRYQSKTARIKKPAAKPQHRVKKPTTERVSSYAPPKRPAPAPKPLAKPSAKLLAKLQEKKKAKEERERNRRRSSYDRDAEDDDGGESELDDFIEEDDEEVDDFVEEDEGYDRDEIWKMFNRGKSRSAYADYDDDLSDMEATGYDVEREERLAAKRAKEEDQKELLREQKMREEKRRRLGKK